MPRGFWLGPLVLLGLAAGACSGNGASPPTDAAAEAGGAYFPCDVQAVLVAKCHTCHSNPPRNAEVPFPLTEYAHVQRDYGGGVRIYQLMRAAIASDFMPLAGSPTGPLTAEQKATMLRWLDDGAPPASQPCAP